MRGTHRPTERWGNSWADFWWISCPAPPCPSHFPAGDLKSCTGDIRSQFLTSSEFLPFALLTATLILPHSSALQSFLSPVIPPLDESFYHFPTLLGQFNELGVRKEIFYHFAQIPTASMFCLLRQAFATHIVSDMLWYIAKFALLQY